MRSHRRFFVGPVGLVIVALVVALGWTSPFMLKFYLATSALSALLYLVDKTAEGSDGRRVPDRQLWLVDAAGGWPGGHLAQQCLRHKTDDVTFRWKFRLAVCLNVAAYAILIAVQHR